LQPAAICIYHRAGQVVQCQIQAAAGAQQVLDLQNNGHTVQVDYGPGSTLVVDGKAGEKRALPGPNNRPVQPLNARVVLR